MEFLALSVTLAATLGIAVYNLYRKFLLNKKYFTERELLVGQCTFAAVVCGLWLFLVGGWWNTLAPEKPDTAIWWIALGATTLVGIVIQFANMRSFRLADASFISPISAMTPGLVVLSALLIGESPTTIGLVGIVLIMGGTYAHIREGTKLREYFVPLFFWLAFRRLEGMTKEEANKWRALRWAYIGAVCSTVGLMGDGIYSRHGDMILAVTIQLAVFAGVYALFLPNLAKDEGEFTPLWERLDAYRWHLILLGAIFAIPFVLLGVAFRLAPIADIGALKRLAIVLTVVGGVVLFGEKSGRRRIFFATVIVAGAILVAYDPAPAVMLDSLDAYIEYLLGRS